MTSIGKIWSALFLGVAFWGGCGQAQTLPQTLPQSSTDALQVMTQLAGVIFAGQVVAVRRHGADGFSAGVVEIEFAVEDAVRGVSGGSYTLREWAGVWLAGDEPFRVGQRYLMLLHSPGAAGLSSPVGGMDGAIPIRGGGGAVAELDGNGNARASVPTSGRVVDLGWVGTRVVQPVSYQPAPVRAGGVARPLMAQAGPVSGGMANGAVAVGPIEKVLVSAPQNTGYASVLGMLRSWETGGHGVR